MTNESDMMDAQEYENEHQNDDIHCAEVAHQEYLEDRLDAILEAWAKRLYEVADEMRKGGVK